MIHGLPWHDIVRGLSESATSSLFAAIWQGALLATAVAFVLNAVPRTPAAARFAIWFTVFLLVAGLPMLAVGAHAAIAGDSVSHSAWLTLNSLWSEGFLAIWVLASCARAITLIIAAFRVRALWRRAKPLPIDQWPALDVQALRRSVQICTTDEIDRPSVIGFFSPKILIPSWLLDKLSPEEMSHVLLHEAGHLRRADDWLNLLQKLALVLFPLNPALLWVERRLCFERELACDERVLRATGAPVAYASCLASLAEHRMTHRGMALVMGALGRESELGKRVLRILSRGERMRPAQTRLVIGTAMLTLVAGTAALERSPQLIGFASSGDVHTAAATRETSPAHPLQRFAYEPVVFHPESPRPSAMKLQQGSAKALSVIRTPRVTPSRTDAPHGLGHALVPNRVSDGWLLMTSTTTWADGGARILMTSVRTSTAVSGKPGTTADLLGYRAPYDNASEGAAQGQVHQVYPYAAAVPVRGGWLIIQL